MSGTLRLKRMIASDEILLARERRARSALAWLLAGSVTFCSPPALAHELLLHYGLPIPFDLYLVACAGVLVVTFALFGWFMRLPTTGTGSAEPAPESASRLAGWIVKFLRGAAVAVLVFTVGAALFATRDPDRNLSETLFWFVFLLGLTYATALVGDVYAFANPWKALVDWMRRPLGTLSRPRFVYPPWLGYWPALALYIALIWIELFQLQKTWTLAMMLIVYSLIVFAGVWLFGKAAWFRYADLFGVFLRVVGMLAPVAYRPTAKGESVSVRFRPPFVGTLEEPTENMSLVVFVLFMLASTTYDGMHQTIFWMGLYYNHLLSMLHPLWGTDLLASQVVLEKWYDVYQRVGLALFPFLYLAIYLGILRLVKLLTKTPLSVRTLALDFAFSIVPIAFVYNIAHYFTLLIMRIPTLPFYLTDPFGLGWNPFGFTEPGGEPPQLNMAIIWHTEVALILIGHLISVYLAHRVALRLFPTRREAMVSQLPMLLLMVIYTVVGLWVISLPFALT
jgi:hypothetical protein